MDEPVYSGKMLGDVEIFLKPNQVLGGVFLVNPNRQIVGGSSLVPTHPGHGDRIVLVIRHDERI